MDGERVRYFFSKEVGALLELYQQFATLICSSDNNGSSHTGEEGRYVETLIREALGKFLPKGIELLTGFIVRPSTKTGRKNRERKNEQDQHSTQLDIIVYDSNRYPVFLRFGNSAVVPPEGVIGIISVKKRLRENDVIKEVEALDNAASLCHCVGDDKIKIRGPYLAIVAMDSLITKKSKTAGEWIFSELDEYYKKRRESDDLDFNNMIGLITALNEFSVFKKRPSKKKVAHFIEFSHGDSEKCLGLQFLLTGLLSVYYDPSRNTISRPGFTCFESGRKCNRDLGEIECNML